MRTCVEKARQAGVRIGFHTLSNFITPNDPYVTPKPDPRLARIGASALTTNVDAAQKEIPVAAPDFFRKQTDMNTRGHRRRADPLWLGVGGRAVAVARLPARRVGHARGGARQRRRRRPS